MAVSAATRGAVPDLAVDDEEPDREVQAVFWVPVFPTAWAGIVYIDGSCQQHRAISKPRAGYCVALMHEYGTLVALVRRAVVALRRRPCGTLFLSGGDTALATLRALGVDCLIPVGEVEPGLAAARCPDRQGPLILMRSGGFGDDAALVRLLAQLAPPTKGTPR